MITILASLLFGSSLAFAGVPSADTVGAVSPGDSGRVVSADSVTTPSGPRQSVMQAALSRTSARMAGTTVGADTTQRRRAVEYSDWYYKRLAIHKTASFATVPLFVAEYIVGDKLFDEGDESGNLKSTHQALATGIGVLFGVNTVTGVWNLWEGRHEPEGRARRFTHSALMLAADAGFVATAALAPEGEGGDDFEDGSSNRNTHRAVAITSMSVALASYLMMYLWK